MIKYISSTLHCTAFKMLRGGERASKTSCCLSVVIVVVAAVKLADHRVVVVLSSLSGFPFFFNSRRMKLCDLRQQGRARRRSVRGP